MTDNKQTERFFLNGMSRQAVRIFPLKPWNMCLVRALATKHPHVAEALERYETTFVFELHQSYYGSYAVAE